MSELQRPRRSPPNDPLFVASRFAWLYATLEFIGGLLMLLIALIGFAPALAAVPQLGIAGLMAFLAKPIRAGERGALKAAAAIAALETLVTLVSAAMLAIRAPIAAIPWLVPVGIRAVLCLQFLAPLRKVPQDRTQ